MVDKNRGFKFNLIGKSRSHYLILYDTLKLPLNQKLTKGQPLTCVGYKESIKVTLKSIGGLCLFLVAHSLQISGKEALVFPFRHSLI